MSRTLYDIIEFNRPSTPGSGRRWRGPRETGGPRGTGGLPGRVRRHTVRVLGDGANLLVDDDGWTAGRGSRRPRQRGIQLRRVAGRGDPARRPGRTCPIDRGVGAEGYSGLESLAGIPASIGGAVIERGRGFRLDLGTGDEGARDVVDGGRTGDPGEQISFDYRHSGLEHLVITSVVTAPRRREDSPGPARSPQEVMAYKKKTQPMADRSAGAASRTRWRWVRTAGFGHAVSAGKLIDEAGCKAAHRRAEVSSVHANFIVTHDCRARHHRTDGRSRATSPRVLRRAPRARGQVCRGPSRERNSPIVLVLAGGPDAERRCRSNRRRRSMKRWAGRSGTSRDMN